ncbi:hypothetical protein CQA53_09670 [Helicobacter didelphidarum]|uniref:Type VI secretion system amidase effector protein Tae4 n=1 Tax=Helicobacter didelphidarum TaxID=2040648 RepID=A0A3D8I9V5_9HELI|nr:T6SS effector amidase Tae4 family protein [Helicobacter didelphidarum]RDU61939.1 hypothetical protein CQA53_09670 [Helicobacter didelphidarum]
MSNCVCEINIKRPCWDCVKEAYEEINTASPNDENLQERFKLGILEEAKWRGGISKTEAKGVADIESKKIDCISARFAMVGGMPLLERIRYLNFFGKSPDYGNYANTCTLQVSYALNKSNMFLENYMPLDKSKRDANFEKALILQGGDKHNYFLRVKEIVMLLKLRKVWGSADKPYTSKTMYSKQENIDFYHNEFFRLNKKGVVAMKIRGWREEYGHITLWGGSNVGFVDYKQEEANNFLVDRGENIVVEIFDFWELK